MIHRLIIFFNLMTHVVAILALEKDFRTRFFQMKSSDPKAQFGPRKAGILYKGKIFSSGFYKNRVEHIQYLFMFCCCFCV